ncbi:hypothetical protein [Streptomyces otsuchiensis]|uniref:hypothetical protein n=1 Tax=Streptomyces otsuchiensis TaxID=2681388 RepID=UPI001030ACD2|nr:hypothetical protein [Streptomyces otsuchiensis]
MTGTDHDYLTDLARRLRASGVPEQQIDTTVRELSDHLDHSGATAEEEFGPLAEFAGQLGARGERSGSAPETAPDADAEEWRWSADIYLDVELLNRYGDQGWEVDRMDRIGRFVARRDRDRAMRWEYRREVVPRRRRNDSAAELAPEGWEPCGHWGHIAYYKRPLSVLVGPDAEVTEPPSGPLPRFFLSRQTKNMMVVGLVGWAILAVLYLLNRTDTGMWIGAAVGGVIGGIAAVIGVRNDLRKRTGAPRRAADGSLEEGGAGSA